MKLPTHILAVAVLAVVLLFAAFIVTGANQVNFSGIGVDWCILTVPHADEEFCQSYLGATASDRVSSKWNAEWDRGKLEGWSVPPYSAYQDNKWNGNPKGGSGFTWYFRIRWVGPCTPGELMPDGGHCIWQQFEFTMGPKSALPPPEWLTQSNPTV